MTQKHDIDNQLRPPTLDEIIGQDHIKESLKVFISASKMQKRTLDHLLLRGNPGLGKTTFALAVASDLGRRLIVRTGPTLTPDAIYDIFGVGSPDLEGIQAILAKVEQKPKSEDIVLFVDEIHGLPKESHELLYPLLEDFRLGDEHVPPFTLIGATTDPGKMPAPLRDRLSIQYTLEYYDNEAIRKILVRSFNILQPNRKYEEEAIDGLVDRARGTPRIANNLLRRALDFMIVDKSKILTKRHVSSAMRAMGIDAWGLTTLDRSILEALHKRFRRAVGLSAVAAALGEDLFTIEHVQEPWLVREGFIDRTPRGRLITAKGRTVAELVEQGKVPF